jgi:hypothetical protein
MVGREVGLGLRVGSRDQLNRAYQARNARGTIQVGSHLERPKVARPLRAAISAAAHAVLLALHSAESLRGH